MSDRTWRRYNVVTSPDVLVQLADHQERARGLSDDLGTDLSGLSLREVDVVEMMVFGGMTVTETALMMGVTTSTVRSYSTAALAKLERRYRAWS